MARNGRANAQVHAVTSSSYRLEHQLKCMGPCVQRLLGTLERAQQTAQRGSRPQPLRVPEVPPGETGELLVQPETLWKASQNALPALCASVSESARAEWMRRLADGAAPLPALAAQGIPFAGMARAAVWDALSKASVPVPRALWLVRLVYAPRSRLACRVVGQCGIVCHAFL